MKAAGWEDPKGALKTVFFGKRPAAKHLRTGHLLVLEGPDAGMEFTVQRERTRVGRSEVNDVVLSDPAVSGIHLELRLTDQGVLLRDLGSTNGTYYGELRIGEGYLAPRAVFRLGNTRVQYMASDEVVEVPLSGVDCFDQVLGRSVRMREIFATLEKVAPSDLTVLIEGETGTGKERIARAIHNNSARAKGPFVVVDCSAIPANLIESTLFGHERGSFTGATERHRGLFEEAADGTIFLDEIGELDMTLQPKLLRVIENRELKRIGGNQTIPTKVRVLAATNRDLRRMVAEGSFRQDLYFRLSVIHLEIPPLRERPEDLPLLLNEFLGATSNPRFGDAPFTVTPEGVARLTRYSWPGNVRELKNVVERSVAMADSPVLAPDDFLLEGRMRGSSTPSTHPEMMTVTAAMESSALGGIPLNRTDLEQPFKLAKQRLVDQFESWYLKSLMERCEGNISQGARESGLTRFHLRELLKKHELSNSKG